MRKALLAVLALVCSCGSAAKQVVVSPQEAARIERAGMQAGYADGYRCGFKAAVDNALAHIREWERDTLALYAGRAMVEEGILEKPPVYTLKGGGEVRLTAGRPAVLRPLEAGKLYAPNWGKGEGVNHIACRPKGVPQGLSPALSLYWSKGYQEGYKKGLKEGSSEALPYVRRVLLSDAFLVREVRKVELGKLLYPELGLSYPAVFRSGAKLRILPPESYSVVSLSRLLEYSSPFVVENSRREESGGVGLVGYSAKPLVPTSPVRKHIKLFLPIQKLPLVEKLGLDYYLAGGKVVVLFKSREEERAFCRRYRLCGGRK